MAQGHATNRTVELSTPAALDDLSDVDTTGQQADDVLTFDGSEWGPAAASGGGGGDVTEHFAEANHTGAAFSRFFDDAETEDSTTVEDTSPNITKTKKYNRLSISHPGGDASAELHGIMWAYAPAGDFYIEGAIRALAISGNHSIMGIIAADGTTYGAGTQMFYGLNGSNGTIDMRNFANYNSQAAGAAHTLSSHLARGVIYLRLAYVSSTNVWTGYWSPDGVSWITGQTQTDSSPSTTHIGFAHSSWGGSTIKHVGAWEYIAAYTGTV